MMYMRDEKNKNAGNIEKDSFCKISDNNRFNIQLTIIDNKQYIYCIQAFVSIFICVKYVILCEATVYMHSVAVVITSHITFFENLKSFCF